MIEAIKKKHKMHLPYSEDLRKKVLTLVNKKIKKLKLQNN